MTALNGDAGLTRVERAQGCLLGQMVGDALGSQVEFQSKRQIQQRYPYGIRRMTGGGTWNTLPGQLTDDSEMALALARTLVRLGRFDAAQVKKAYLRWYDSKPFDVGNTVARGLGGRVNAQSQANGALMRISPLGIFGVNHSLKEVASWAQADAKLTHPHTVCLQINSLFTMAIATAVSRPTTPEALFEQIKTWAEAIPVNPEILEVIHLASQGPPADYVTDQGWVLIAFHNALWQLLSVPDFEEACMRTAMEGGDTDTNAAICGALLGAVYGVESIPRQWREAVLSCRPSRENKTAQHPRPEEYWAVDALDLAIQLLNEKGVPSS